MKKPVALLLSLALCFLPPLSGMAEAMMPGGWATAESLTVTDEIREAFDKAAAELDGSLLEPVAVLGMQVVAGMNYRILCNCTPVVPDPVAHPVVVTLYAGIDGTAEFTDIADFDLSMLRVEDGK